MLTSSIPRTDELASARGARVQAVVVVRVALARAP
jgi:hypothetical protein